MTELPYDELDRVVERYTGREGTVVQTFSPDTDRGCIVQFDDGEIAYKFFDEITKFNE